MTPRRSKLEKRVLFRGETQRSNAYVVVFNVSWPRNRWDWPWADYVKVAHGSVLCGISSVDEKVIPERTDWALTTSVGGGWRPRCDRTGPQRNLTPPVPRPRAFHFRSLYLHRPNFWMVIIHSDRLQLLNAHNPSHTTLHSISLLLQLIILLQQRTNKTISWNDWNSRSLEISAIQISSWRCARRSHQYCRSSGTGRYQYVAFDSSEAHPRLPLRQLAAGSCNCCDWRLETG